MRIKNLSQSKDCNEFLGRISIFGVAAPGWYYQYSTENELLRSKT